MNNDATDGSYTDVVNSKASYTFNGTKVQVFSPMKDDSALVTIKIDGSTEYQVDFYRKQKVYGIAFTSDTLPFGEHTIEISHSGKSPSSTNTKSFVVITSLLIYPLPKKKWSQTRF